MSESLTLARPYARAAFAVAREQGRVPEWSEALGFAALAVAEPSLRELLGHPSLDAARLAALLAPDDAGETERAFFRLLADNRRVALLPEIADLFAALRAEAERVIKARVTTAAPAQADEIAAIRTALERRFGRTVELETAIEPELIGGVRVEAGDIVIDGSLRGKLDRLRAAL